MKIEASISTSPRVNGLRLEGDGALVVQTPVGPLRDAAPVSYQDIDGTRVPVDSSYELGAAGEYGFVVGAYRPDQPLVIDPGLEYSTFIGGSSHEQVHGLAVDGNGNAIVVGMTQSSDFPTTPGAIDSTFNGGVMDVFVTKFNAAGSGLVYSTYMGGTPARLRRGSETPFETARAVAVDAAGNAYVTGLMDENGFPTTPGAFQTAKAGGHEGFVTKLNATGSALIYSTYLGGREYDTTSAIAVDANGNAYVTGGTSSPDFPTTAGAFRTVIGGGRCADPTYPCPDVFVTKLNPAGTGLVYSTAGIGGSGIALDADGNAYLTGTAFYPDPPTTPGAF